MKSLVGNYKNLNYKDFFIENLSLSKSTAKEEVCTVGLFEDRL